MIIWIPYVIGVGSVLGVLVLIWQRRQRQIVQARVTIADTLVTCRLLVRLIAHLQQHRGMSSAWLSGDLAFQPRMLAKQAEIAKLLPEINHAARGESLQSCPCLTHNDLSLLSFRWRSLLDDLPGLTTEQSMAQHSQLVARALEWLAAMGETRVESLANDRRVLGAARNFAHRLPQLTECLGQARGIGSSVAAKQSCAPVARVRLMFLIARAESLLDQAVSAWDGGPVTQRSRQSIEEMATAVRTRMLLSSGVRVSSADYFAMATKAIDGVFEWIDVCAREVERGIGEPGSADWAGKLAG